MNGNPPAIFDQRHMSGPELRGTIAEVEESWREFARLKRGETRPVPPQFHDPGYEIHVRKGTARAYVSDGRWVADCPNPRCNGGIACWPEHARGCCLVCGSIWTISFPSAEQIRMVEEAFAVRPQQHRHWKPWEQDANEIRLENIQHGYAPDTATGDDAYITNLARELNVEEETVRAIITRDREQMGSTGRFA